MTVTIHHILIARNDYVYQKTEINTNKIITTIINNFRNDLRSRSKINDKCKKAFENIGLDI